MLTGLLNSIRHDRATFIHEVAHIREIASEDDIADRVGVAESQYVKEDIDDLREAKQLYQEMTIDDSRDEKEIQKILESTTDLTFDQMIGITE